MSCRSAASQSSSVRVRVHRQLAHHVRRFALVSAAGRIQHVLVRRVLVLALAPDPVLRLRRRQDNVPWDVLPVRANAMFRVA